MKELYSFFSINREDYSRVKEDVWKENWEGLRFFSFIAFIAFGVMAIVSMLSPSIGKNLILYIVYGIISLLIWGASHVKTNDIRVKEVLVYTFFAILLSYGIVMGTVVSPQDLTVSYIVLIIAVPLIFNARAYVMNVLILFSIIVYIIIAYFTQNDLIFTYNLLDVIPYGILSMFVTSAIMRSKLQRLLYQNEVESLAEIEKVSQERISNYETFITDMVRYSSSEENPDKVLTQLVQYIGEKLHSDRAYIFEENSHGTFDNTYEWCKEGVSKEIDNLQNVPYEGIIEIWYEQYKKFNNIVIHDIEEYRKHNEAIYDLLKPQGVNTLVAGPIVIKGKMVGFYGVDNPPKELLNDIADLIGMMEFVVSFLIRLRDNAKNLEYSSLHDQLTNCKNRKALDWVYSMKHNTNKSLGVVMCDLNGLKEINDNQGHDAGDRFILRAADTLKSVFGDEQVYRIGGDEFIAVLTDIAKKDFEEKHNLACIRLGTTASIGVVYKDKMDTDFDSVLKIADAEMYKQKNDYYISTGKNRRK